MTDNENSVVDPGANPPPEHPDPFETSMRAPDRQHYDEGEFPLSMLRQVTVNRPGRPQETFALRLPAEAVEELRERAQARSMGVTQLVREWILERLQLERRRPGVADEALLWDRTKAAVEELLPEIVSRVKAAS